jgi:hypothetical protein
MIYGPYTSEHKLGSKPTWKWSLRRSDEVSDVLGRIQIYMGKRRTERIEGALSRLTNCRSRPGRKRSINNATMAV